MPLRIERLTTELERLKPSLSEIAWTIQLFLEVSKKPDLQHSLSHHSKLLRLQALCVWCRKTASEFDWARMAKSAFGFYQPILTLRFVHPWPYVIEEKVRRLEAKQHSYETLALLIEELRETGTSGT
jgi:hypothetical protein